MVSPRHALTAALLSLTSALAQEPAREDAPQSVAEQMQATIDDLRRRVTDLESAAHAARIVLPSEQLQQGRRSPIRDRQGLYDRQEAAARLDDLTLDPDFRGFIPVPNTPALIRFNAKPRLDATFDNRNTGDRYRFVPGLIPADSDPGYGGGRQFNLNSNGTQLSVDVRAPETPGDFRFYYQSDFFGSDAADMRYRLQHAYGQYHNIVAGYTFSVFEDPDGWPDTVDYEGPNAVIFARRPVLQFKTAIDDEWNATFGIEKPDVYVDTMFDPTVTLVTRMPDLGANVRWEREGTGHVQLSAIVRSVGANGTAVGEQTDFAWGLNCSAAVDVTDRDTVQTWLVGGAGIAGMGNDTSFHQSDAAFTATGDLEALPYWSVLFGYTHRWCDTWRSTATFGYAHLQNSSGQAPGAFHASQYWSANAIYQIGPRLSAGAEILYGHNEHNNGATGDAVRLQLSMVYSIF